LAEVIKTFLNLNSRKVKTTTLFKWATFPRNAFYYKRADGKRGRKPSQTTLTGSGEVLDDSQVVEVIKDQLKVKFCCDRYKKTHSCLRESGC
jgi:hypothetical protein